MSGCGCGDQERVDLAALHTVLDRYAEDDGALIPILQASQEAYGYLPEAVLKEIARVRRVPASEVYGVATFYTQFHLNPRGKTVVRVCHGTACHVSGAPEITRSVSAALGVAVGETTEDGRFTLESVGCVGCCGLAPVIVAGSDTFGRIDGKKASAIIESLFEEES